MTWAIRGIRLILVLAVVGYAPAAVNAQQPKTRTLTEQEVVDMLVGACIQATRGCSSDSYVRRAKDAMAAGAEFKMIALDDLPDDWMTVSPAGVGGGGAWQHVIDRTEEQGLARVENTSLKSIALLADYLDTEFDAMVRLEAAGATISALLLAAEMGIPIVDACLSQRARPEIQQQIPWLNGIPATPAALVTRWGDEVIIQRGVDDYRAEDLARGVAVSSGGGASIAMNPMTGAQVKRGTIPNALTSAILVGRTVREARAQGRDPVDALIDVIGGYKLFQGTVTKSDQRGEFGFSWTDAELTGTGPYAGHTYGVFVKNENIVSWLDGEVDAVSPDYIYNLDPTTGEAVIGGGLGGYEMGAEIVMVGVPAPPEWKTAEAIEVIGPRHFGFDFDYVPLEELQRSRKVKF